MSGPSWSTRAIRELDDAFAQRRDPERAARMHAYMRNRFEFFGIPAPERRAVQAAVFRSLPAPASDDVFAFADACWARDEREYQYAATDLIRRRITLLRPDDLPRLERLIATKSWWDTVDQLAAAVGAIVDSHPAGRDVMDRWLEQSDMWLIRVAILHQRRWRDDADAAWLFAACRRHASHPDFFVRKAIGWALRSHAARHPAAVREFLDRHGSELAGLARREAEKGVARGLRA